MYDKFSSDYDHFVNWESRLAVELPFLEQTMRPLSGPVKVLDAACGTGMHAIALAQLGFAAAAADLSEPMVARGRMNAEAAGVKVHFATAGFGELAGAFQLSPLFPFDAIICLGNSLPHLLAPTQVSAAMADFAACLRPGGLLIIQNRNFDAVMLQKERWMEPQSYSAGQREWVFLRFYDYDPDGLITFNIITLFRKNASTWQQQVNTTRLYPQREQELTTALHSAGFDEVTAYGNLSGAAFNPASSGNLVLIARLQNSREPSAD